MEGFNRTQESLLRSRRKDGQELTEEEKWYKVYRILFPNDDHTNMPSPCKPLMRLENPFVADIFNIDYDGSYLDDSVEGASAADAEWAEYEEFLRRELPQSVRRELELRVDELLESAEETLKTELPRIFRDLQLRIFQDYQQQRKSQSKNVAGPEFGQLEPPQLEAEELYASVDPESRSGIDAQLETSVSEMLSYDGFPDWFDGALYDIPLDLNLFSDSGYSSTPARHSLPPSWPENSNADDTEDAAGKSYSWNQET